MYTWDLITYKKKEEEKTHAETRNDNSDNSKFKKCGEAVSNQKSVSKQKYISRNLILSINRGAKYSEIRNHCHRPFRFFAFLAIRSAM